MQVCNDYLQINYDTLPTLAVWLKVDGRSVDTSNLVIEGHLKDLFGNVIVKIPSTNNKYVFNKTILTEIRTYFESKDFDRHTAVLQTFIQSQDASASYYDRSLDMYLEFIK